MSEKSKKPSIPESAIPLDGLLLSSISLSEKGLLKALQALQKEAVVINRLSGRLNIEDARKIECPISVLNIRKCAASINTYLGTAIMLLENIADDVENCNKARRIYKEAYERRLAAQLAAQENAKRQADFREKQKEQAPETPAQE